ncbi:nuclease-related domain-containing protein [Robertmurraya sp. P23]|uniref:nuclease-related domain-containing protein n=1 Tax=Robertmurraya sp. P23 TaxID=3436931 RepID=UPI003D95E6E9
MILKCRTESDELLTLRSLNTRMTLTEKEKFHYSVLEKGFEGERKFDQLLEILQEERYILNDLLLEVNNSYFQIDSLIISQEAIYLLDVKNYQGDYYLDSDKLYSVTTDREYKNPVTQLQRSATLFRQLLQSLKRNFLVEASVIFINPEFTLYQCPVDQPFIFPTQVNRFLKSLNQITSKLNDEQKKLAKKLISLHQPKNPFNRLPEYHYDHLQKGIYCKTCFSFAVSVKTDKFVCEKCGDLEKIPLGILRNVKEFMLLFPERKITTQSIYDWCQVDLCKKTIYRTLKKNYTPCGNTRDTYYV